MEYFKGKQFEPDIILLAASLSYREVSKILKKHGDSIHLTMTIHWVHKYGNSIYQIQKKKNNPVHWFWKLGEIYIKLEGYTLDIHLRKKRDHQVAYTFTKTFGEPMLLTTDKKLVLLYVFNKFKNVAFIKAQIVVQSSIWIIS